MLGEFRLERIIWITVFPPPQLGFDTAYPETLTGIAVRILAAQHMPDRTHA